MKAVRNLLGGLIDYAGLFPPAALSMEKAVANYYSYLKSDYSWILGRFILPISRLSEFEAVAAGYDLESDLIISAISDGILDQDLGLIADFNARNFLRYLIDSIEVKTSDSTEIAQISAKTPEMMHTYIEIPLSDALERYVEQLAAFGRMGKIRTGGIKEEMFPRAEYVTRFLVACAHRNVPFKATAGLHHPIRAIHNLTYEPDSARCKMHGFLNLFLAAIFCKDGHSSEEINSILMDEDSRNFRFTDDAAYWKENQVESYRVLELRQKFCTSFGSCSFEEPLQDLKTLGVL